jgi:hypothetical protein
MSSIGSGLASIGEGLSSIFGSFSGESQARYEENLKKFTAANEKYLKSGKCHADYLALKADQDALSYYRSDSPNTYWPMLPQTPGTSKIKSKRRKRNG